MKIISRTELKLRRQHLDGISKYSNHRSAIRQRGWACGVALKRRKKKDA